MRAPQRAVAAVIVRLVLVKFDPPRSPAQDIAERDAIFYSIRVAARRRPDAHPGYAENVVLRSAAMRRARVGQLLHR